MAACGIDLILNAEVSGTSATHIGSARIITGSNTQASFRAMIGTSTTATASVEVRRFTGATSILKLNTAGIGLQDVSGSQRTIGNSAVTGSWATGKVDEYSLEFTGSGAGGSAISCRVELPLGATTGSSDGLSGTIACWIYPDTIEAGQYPYIFGCSKDSPSGAGQVGTLFDFYLDGNNSDRLTYRVRDNNVDETKGYAAASIPTGEWTHVAVTTNGAVAGATFYINGVADAGTFSPDAGSWFGDLNTVTVDNATIGNLRYNGSSWYPFDGKIDEFAIWTEPLNLGGIQALYKGGSGAKADTVSSSYLVSYYDMEGGPGASTLADRTGNGYNGTLTNMETGSLLLVDDWYDFYASGSAADISTLIKGIKVTLY
tara:strand:+ start:1057 stop:2175 length:1119 start_codon:yes stop_codon:yes gene_type:complete